MPYKLREDHNSNRRIKYRLKVIANYAADHVRPIHNKARSDIYCPLCLKISKYSTPKKYRHYTDCEYA